MHSSNEVKAQLLVVLAGYETHQGRYISAVAEGASIAARGVSARRAKAARILIIALLPMLAARWIEHPIRAIIRGLPPSGRGRLTCGAPSFGLETSGKSRSTFVDAALALDERRKRLCSWLVLPRILQRTRPLGSGSPVDLLGISGSENDGRKWVVSRRQIQILQP